MDLTLFGFSFIFSIIFIILGFKQESAVLELVGSISLMILALLLLTTHLQTIYVDATNVYTYTFATETATPIGFLFFFFGFVVCLYSGKLILYGKAGE